MTSGRADEHITLNAIEIAFQSVTVTAGGKEQTATVSLDKEKEQATFTFPKQLPAGKATLTINYTGILNNELRGFYLSKTDKRNYAVTQFESTDARRAFPVALTSRRSRRLTMCRWPSTRRHGDLERAYRSDTPGPGAASTR